MTDASSQTERTAWFATVSPRVAMVRSHGGHPVALALALRCGSIVAGFAALGAVGCAGGSGQAKDPSAEGEALGTPEDAASPRATPGEAPGASGREGPGASGGQPLAERPAPVDGRAADPTRGLPEVSVRHIGLHVGGGPNDEATRRPILRALEQHTQQFLWCYRQVDRPLRGGVYGVDLYVPSSGGRPDVRSTRQKLGPAEFDRCMSEAFRGVSLPRPPRATVVSYSLRFDVVDPTERR